MKRILLTGASGFIGSYATKHFLDEGWQVKAICRQNKAGSLYRLERILDHPNLEIIWADLKSNINKGLSNKIGDVDVICHMAAESHVDDSISDPNCILHDNITSTFNLLEYARSKEVRPLFYYWNTDEVFGNKDEGFSKEDDVHRPRNPYSASKSAAEQLCNAWANTYKIPLITTYTMNVYGPFQSTTKYIPLCVKKILRGEQILIHATPNCEKAGSRMWIHAQDAARGALFAIENLRPGERLNLVGEVEKDNLEIAQTIASYLGMPLNYKLIDWHSSRSGHDTRYALDPTKLNSMGWKYLYTFDQGIRQTVNYYKEHLS